MPEHRDSHPKAVGTLREQGWAPKRRRVYPPPQAVNHYSSRALPPPPGHSPARTPSPSSSVYDSEEEGPPENKQKHLESISQDDVSRKRATFGGAIDEEALAMVRPPQIKIPSHSHEDTDEYQHVVSPQPQYPESTKLISLWEDGDELVSPIDTPGTANWNQHVVSPLSEGSEKGTGSDADQVSVLESDASLDDSIVDKAEQRHSSGARNRNEHSDKSTFLGTPRLQGLKKSRFSDPGSPHKAAFSLGEYGEPGPDVGGKNRLDNNTSRRQTSRRQPHSMYLGDSRSHAHEMPAIGESGKPSFPPQEGNAFPIGRPLASPRPTPPLPSRSREQALEEENVGPPFALRTDPGLSQKQTPNKAEESASKQQKRTSGFANFGASFRSSIQRTEKFSPGFEDILNKADSNQAQGKTSPVPKVKNILSKAKLGLGLGSSDDSKREKRREELKRQIRLGNAE